LSFLRQVTILDSLGKVYVMQFNERLCLSYLSDFHRSHMETLFAFPRHVDSLSEVHLSSIVGLTTLRNKIFKALGTMREKRQKMCTIEKPKINLTMEFDEAGRGTSCMMIVKISELEEIKGMDFKEKIAYVLSSMDQKNSLLEEEWALKKDLNRFGGNDLNAGKFTCNLNDLGPKDESPTKLRSGKRWTGSQENLDHLEGKTEARRVSSINELALSKRKNSARSIEDWGTHVSHCR
jgi:hypothetical protein